MSEDQVHESGAEMPVFDGAAELLECLRLLIRRPRLREAPRPRAESTVHRAPQGIPILCLIRRGDNGALLQALARFLTRARPRRVPHVVYRYPGTDLLPGSSTLKTDALEISGVQASSADAEAVSAVLLALSRGLSGGANARNGRIRFTRFGLVRWLMAENLDLDDADADTVLRSRLRGRDLARARYSGLFSKRLPELADGSLPKWAQLLQLFPPIWFLVRVGGRVPGVGTEYRWLLRQPYLAPLDPGTFLGFAERLSAGQRGKEDPEQVLRLLVNAFLGDVRAAYRRRPWRPRAARRTTYPVVLLDGITRANNGYRLLRLINDVRNDTGTFDPLLVITASQAVPPDAGALDEAHRLEGTRSAAQARSAYKDWCRRVSDKSRKRTKTAWYLPIEIPPVLIRPQTPSSSSPYGTAAQELQATDPITIDPAPVWARQSTLAVLVTIMALSLIGSAYHLHSNAVAQTRLQNRAAGQWKKEHCGLSPSESFARYLTMMSNGTGAGGECIGITDGSHPFQHDTGLTTGMQFVEGKIAHLDVEAAAAHALAPGRPFVTLVYVGILTSRDNSADYADEIWSMEGIAAAQKDQLDYSKAPTDPIIRVLIANAGDSMGHGTDVAHRLATMKNQGAPIVGVVGLDESRSPTVRTIQELTKAELPVVADELSYDGLSEISRWYFQVSPDNSREAAVASGWVREKLATMRKTSGQKPHLIILRSSDAQDYYSKNLGQDFADDLKASDPQPIAYSPESFTDPTKRTPARPIPVIVSDDLCNRNDLVIFTGRNTDFKTLRTDIDDDCLSPAEYPTLLGGDDVSRYAADTSSLNHLTVPFFYASFAVGPQNCSSRENPPYSEISMIFEPKSCTANGDVSLDGHAALSYDAVRVYVKAINTLTSENPEAHYPVTSAQVAAYIPRLQFTGATGEIAFTSTYIKSPSQLGVPVNKSVAILGVSDGNSPKLIGQCDTKPNPSWCQP